MRKVLLLVALLMPISARAELTSTQIQTLHSDIISRPELEAYVATGNDIALADFYNAVAVPDFIVWRTNVTQEEYQSVTSPAATNFSWSGAGGYIARSQGERDAWRIMFMSGSVNPSQANVITAFNDIFSGTGAGAINNRTHLLSLSKRKATLLEKLFSTGTGSDTSPASPDYQGFISPSEISRAR